MSVTIKTPGEIELMREAGRILALVHEELGKIIEPGISTYEIDKEGERLIRSFSCIPSFLNYNGYPASICVSVNEEVVHGIPSRKRILKEGDIVSLDAGVIYKGYHSDAARTYGVGKISKEAELLIENTKKSFFAGIEQAKAGNLCGHGIGTHLHEDPDIPNFIQKKRGIKLAAGMTLAVEPMINIGTYKVCWLDDDWTVVTYDGSLSAHYENTILITEEGCEILSIL